MSFSVSAFSIDPDSISLNDKRPYALVAGGSKGIGYAVAEALAVREFNLILIARNDGPLQDAKQKLEAKYGITVKTLVYDLADARAAKEISKWCIDRDIPLKMLCNVAGLGGARDYPELPLDSLRYMSDLNVESCMAMSLLLLPLLEKNAPSYILNVSSMAGFAPIPAKNLYSATKSSVLFFSYSLHYQLKEKNISVSVLTPGPVFTKPSIKRETKEKLGFLGMTMAVSPEKVGEIAVRSTLRKKLLIVPGTASRLLSMAIRLMPMRMSAAVYNKLGG